MLDDHNEVEQEEMSISHISKAYFSAEATLYRKAYSQTVHVQLHNEHLLQKCLLEIARRNIVRCYWKKLGMPFSKSNGLKSSLAEAKSSSIILLKEFSMASCFSVLVFDALPEGVVLVTRPLETTIGG